MRRVLIAASRKRESPKFSAHVQDRRTGVLAWGGCPYLSRTLDDMSMSFANFFADKRIAPRRPRNMPAPFPPPNTLEQAAAEELRSETTAAPPAPSGAQVSIVRKHDFRFGKRRRTDERPEIPCRLLVQDDASNAPSLRKSSLRSSQQGIALHAAACAETARAMSLPKSAATAAAKSACIAYASVNSAKAQRP